jgi:hypothetical protein
MADAAARRGRSLTRARHGGAARSGQRRAAARFGMPGPPTPRKGRRVRRVVRNVDTRTVLKVSFLFYLCVLLVFLFAGILLWTVAAAFGVIHNVEKFIQKLFDLNSFRFQAWSILLGTGLGGFVFVMLGTGTNVLAVLLYNLISDVVGGVEVEIVDEGAD